MHNTLVMYVNFYMNIHCSLRVRRLTGMDVFTGRCSGRLQRKSYANWPVIGRCVMHFKLAKCIRVNKTQSTAVTVSQTILYVVCDVV